MDEKFTARSTNIGPLEVRGKMQFIFFPTWAYFWGAFWSARINKSEWIESERQTSPKNEIQNGYDSVERATKNERNIN